jgi:hypothetical protein
VHRDNFTHFERELKAGRDPDVEVSKLVVGNDFWGTHRK